MSVLIGTSGWQYRHWRGTFYPPRLNQGLWLEYYADRFCTVESNYAFYRLPKASAFEGWARRTPGDFVMAVKASRYLTHIKRLLDPEEPVRLGLERATRLGPKLGPILVQLPPKFGRDVDRLRRTLNAYGTAVRVAVEFRHESWFTHEVRDVLTEHGAALCLADRKGPLTPTWRTTDWSYVRFHEGEADPRPCYLGDSLDGWARRIAEGWSRDEDVYVYFNNDPRACALRDAVVFADALDRVGLIPSRVPPASDISLG